MALKLSIITPCFNRADFIATAIDSVRCQWRDGMEHIIVDGGSTDGTLDILDQYDHLTVISEPDENLYDAVNKGLALAQGEVIGWLNSDDKYDPTAFQSVLPLFDEDPDLEMVCGGATIAAPGHHSVPKTTDIFDRARNKNLEFHDLLFDVPIINARFFRRSLFDRVGEFDLRFMPASDREFLLRCALADTRVTAIDAIVHEYVTHAGSATITQGTAHWKAMATSHLDLAEFYLQKPTTSPDLRRYLFSFHAKNALIGAAGELAQGRVASGFALMGRGWSRNLFWPFWALYHASDWLVRRIAPRGI